MGDVAAWAIGLSLFGVMLGWGATTFDELFTDVAIIEDWLSTMGGETVGEAFLAILTFDVRLIVACIAIVTALRLRGEETRGHVDPVLAGPTSRSRWLHSHIVIAFAGPSIILLAVGLCTGVIYGMTTGRPGALLDQLATALLFVPAAWFMAGITIALFGLVPRAVVAASWGIMGVSIIFVFLWEVRAIGQTAFLITPFAYTHPAVDPPVIAPFAFTLLAGLLTTIGALAFRQRDIGG